MIHKTLETWIKEIDLLCTPDKIIMWNGTQTEYDAMVLDLVSQKKSYPPE